MIGDYLDKYTFEYLINDALSRVPDTIDKRQGSIIYDALAPACAELAQAYIQLKGILIETYADTASGEYLDKRVAERGLTRYGSTFATRKGTFTTASGDPVFVPLGSRFSTISETETVNYTVTAPYLNEDGVAVPGVYILTAETAGTIGNDYIGNLLPINFIQGLAVATITDIIIPGRDTETDEELRIRYFQSVNSNPFGGNIAQYDSAIKGIAGVGELQIYPTWNGGGTVKCSIIDSSYRRASSSFVEYVQELIDPQSEGSGLGLAPIGHRVTITTPDEITIDIEMNVTLSSGYSLPQVEQDIIDKIEAYIDSLRRQWGIPDELNNYHLSVYIAQINAAVISVTGVANVTGTTINGVAEDLELTQNATTQQLPILGEVIIHAS